MEQANSSEIEHSPPLSPKPPMPDMGTRIKHTFSFIKDCTSAKGEVAEVMWKNVDPLVEKISLLLSRSSLESPKALESEINALKKLFEDDDACNLVKSKYKPYSTPAISTILKLSRLIHSNEKLDELETLFTQLKENLEGMTGQINRYSLTAARGSFSETSKANALPGNKDLLFTALDAVITPLIQKSKEEEKARESTLKNAVILVQAVMRAKLLRSRQMLNENPAPVESKEELLDIDRAAITEEVVTPTLAEEKESSIPLNVSAEKAAVIPFLDVLLQLAVSTEELKKEPLDADLTAIATPILAEEKKPLTPLNMSRTEEVATPALDSSIQSENSEDEEKKSLQKAFSLLQATQSSPKRQKFTDNPAPTFFPALVETKKEALEPELTIAPTTTPDKGVTSTDQKGAYCASLLLSLAGGLLLASATVGLVVGALALAGLISVPLAIGCVLGAGLLMSTSFFKAHENNDYEVEDNFTSSCAV